MWDKEPTASPRSPRPHEPRRDDRARGRYDDDRGHNSRCYEGKKRARSRSRSPEDHARSERKRSRSRDRTYRERDRDKDRRRDRSAEKHDKDRRDYDRERVRDKESKHRTERHRSPSPVRNGAGRTRRNSPPRGPRTDHDRRDEPNPESKAKEEPAAEIKVNGDAKMDIDEDEEDTELRRMMGFTSFKTTQNKKVPGNQIYAVRKEKKTVYRQYMNRVGGFNRPLSPGS